ncbi:exonuclease SbcCD subunit D C-terminal domain-containing protein [Pontiella sulfatireligans]|uniref:Nuclease SbcCD subunit D n=1 Tax=Pontiella sulfatireligans TaxID=2750658 RepID=A0A6C2UTE7_9BACT|nr:exonuclease SbcCD subunit D C-terminal domain-containing protein [Pontiella sulfatireligans]VGO22541.1 Nuclease SbcCD subunit D [Pontiella sulfatireligans]
MKILHTSDWHLGRSLYGRARYAEFGAFLDWLAEHIEQHHIDILLVAGDIFDTTAPSNRAQNLYYSFLTRVAQSTACRHIIVIGGNHDSPSFLDAPKTMLRALNIHVVGTMAEDELLICQNQEGVPEAIVCAVPYLRDRDIRQSETGESMDDKRAKLAEGYRAHYHGIGKRAEAERSEQKIPIIGMGHCFAAGGTTVADDGVRDLNVGSLDHVEASAFPACFDYLALGHLHVPQKIAGSETMRYCGSPIPMGFGEANQQKIVLEITFAGRAPQIEEIPIPCFQPLRRVSGGIDDTLAALKQLKLEGSNAWVEVEYTAAELIPDLREQVEAAIEGTSLEIRRIKNKRVMDRVLQRIDTAETLDDLEPADVFARCLEEYEVPAEQRAALTASYTEILQTLHEADAKAE